MGAAAWLVQRVAVLGALSDYDKGGSSMAMRTTDALTHVAAVRSRGHAVVLLGGLLGLAWAAGMSTPTRTPTTTRTRTTTSRSVHRAGAWCLGAGLVGVAQAAILLVWSPQVSDDRYSYPFSGIGFAVAQASFFLQHLPLIAAVAALMALRVTRASRTARIAVGAAVVGLVLLTAMELITIIARDAATDSSLATLVNSLYGPPVILIGAGLSVAGIALVRQGTAGWPGARWVPALVLVLGVYVFVALTPAIMGTFTAGRFGIGGWMLLFAALGFGLTRLADDQR